MLQFKVTILIPYIQILQFFIKVVFLVAVTLLSYGMDHRQPVGVGQRLPGD